MGLLDLQETEETLAEEVPKVPKDKQETEGKWESEETRVQADKITTKQDRKETLVMLDQRESLVKMERREALVKSEEGELMAEEVHLDSLEILESQEPMVCRESLALVDLEVHLDLMVPQDPEEKMGTRDPGVLAVTQVRLGKRAEEELLVARESQETQDLRVVLDPLAPVESLVKMVEMGLVSPGPKEERVMKDSLDSQDQRGQVVTPATMVDLDPQETVDRGVSLGTLVQVDRKERLDILGHMVRRGQEDQVLCNVTWSRRLGKIVLAVMVRRNARSTPLSWPLPWMPLRMLTAELLTTCVTLSCAWSETSPSLRATVLEALALL